MANNWFNANTVTAYMNKLLEQDDVTICPKCAILGKRQQMCKNAVLKRLDYNQGWNKDNVALVCCWLGDEYEQVFDQERFAIKVKIMKDINGTKRDAKTGEKYEVELTCDM